MQVIKFLCIIIFIIITILFTVGYAALPIINAQSTTTNPQATNTTVSGATTFYISHFSSLLGNGTQNFTQNNNYSDISGSGVVNTIFQTLLYMCIAGTTLLALGIVIALFGMKFISKFIFLLAFIAILGVCIMVLLITFKTNFVQPLIDYFAIPEQTTSNINCDNGGILIITSTALMFLNYMLYMFLA